MQKFCSWIASLVFVEWMEGWKGHYIPSVEDGQTDSKWFWSTEWDCRPEFRWQINLIWTSPRHESTHSLCWNVGWHSSRLWSIELRFIQLSSETKRLPTAWPTDTAPRAHLVRKLIRRFLLSAIREGSMKLLLWLLAKQFVSSDGNSVRLRIPSSHM